MLMIFELACIFFSYTYKREVHAMRSHRSFYSFIILFISYAFYFVQIFSHANTIFENFISQYEDDDDVRTLVDTIQSEVAPNRNFYFTIPKQN